MQTFDSNKPCEYWKLWKSFNIQIQNSSIITHSGFGKYFTDQVRPPNMDYFDKVHMTEIEKFISKYDKNEPIHTFPDLGSDICNGSITLDEIITHIDKIKIKKAVRY